MSAGGHFNAHGKKHGYLTEDGPHAGDMPNQVVALDGILRANVLNPNVTLTESCGNAVRPGWDLLGDPADQDNARQPEAA